VLPDKIRKGGSARYLEKGIIVGSKIPVFSGGRVRGIVIMVMWEGGGSERENLEALSRQGKEIKPSINPLSEGKKD